MVQDHDYHHLEQTIVAFVASTRDYLAIRPEDNVLILRPNRIHYLNATAATMLSHLYQQNPLQIRNFIHTFSSRYQVGPERIVDDLNKLIQSLSLLLRNDPLHAPLVRIAPFGTNQYRYPVLSEIALTYRCQLRCTFCYASAPTRGRHGAQMTTQQLKMVIDKIVDQAHVPTLSFTGGEPTMHRDVLHLIAYARSRGLRVNLITNGIRSARRTFAEQLAEAGLHSAQVSLESGHPAIHDAIVQRPGAFHRTIAGIRNLKAVGIHTHTNTTITRNNVDSLPHLIDLLADMGQEYLSMNMVIRTGEAVGKTDIDYRSIGEILLRLKAHAEARGMRFVWYSPLPYCLFNTIANGLGGQSCSAADGLLSIAPDGQVLPCSSFERGIGNLLTEDFTTIWNSPAARYWRNKQFTPPGCKGCQLENLCHGACPLYWDEQGNFDAIRTYMRHTWPWQKLWWRVKRRLIGRVWGVGITR